MELLQSKKGAVELSLNLIIMLIIGLTVLGLVIGFVVNLVNQATDDFEGRLSDLDQRQLDQVMEEPGYFAAGPSTIKIKPGDKGKMYIKIDNIGDNDLTIDSFDEQGPNMGSGTLKFAQTNIEGDCVLRLISPEYTIKPKEAQGLVFNVEPLRDSCTDGNEMFLKVTFEPTADNSRTETLTITVES